MTPTSQDETRNPFHTLYVTETARSNPGLFVRLFGERVLAGEVRHLFLPGNTILRGSQGIGKTMLLSLFVPEVALAYLKREQPLAINGFPAFSIGINFTLDGGFSSLGQRQLSPDPRENVAMWAATFGDMFNYVLVGRAIDLLTRFSSTWIDLGKALKVNLDPTAMNNLANTLVQEECWYGYLNACKSIEDIRQAARGRVRTYREFIGWNREFLPTNIAQTKTEIGIPLTTLAKCAHQAGVVMQPLIVTIDQTEVLLNVDLESAPSTELSIGRALCRAVNSVFASRSPHVSYKAAWRPFALEEDPRVGESNAYLEEDRDFVRIDLDEMLRQQENTPRWLFKAFAEELTTKRLVAYGWESPDKVAEDDPAPIEKYFAPLSIEEKYSLGEGRRPRRGPILQLPTDLTEDWREYLNILEKQNPLEAAFTIVWLHQHRAQNSGYPPCAEVTLTGSSPSTEHFPWRREWWRKERAEAIRYQIASKRQQRVYYGGWDGLLRVAGSSTIVLLSLLREVWDIYLRQCGPDNGPISPKLLSQAVRLVASRSLDRVNRGAYGATRVEFLQRLGTAFRQAIVQDSALSYPGWTGFSLDKAEFDACTEVRAFLNRATSLGDFVRRPHTTKEKDGRPRVKWYLAPIICAHFEIPPIRTKEPYYATLSEIQRWICRGETIRLRPRHDPGPLFHGLEERE